MRYIAITVRWESLQSTLDQRVNKGEGLFTMTQVDPGEYTLIFISDRPVPLEEE